MPKELSNTQAFKVNTSYNIRRVPRKYKLLSWMISIIFCSIPFYICQFYWKWLRDTFEDKLILLTFISVVVVAVAGTSTLGFYWILYHYEIPYFEQFKTNDMPWPWKLNKKAWKQKFRELMWTYFYNNFLIAPILMLIFYYLSNPDISFEFPSLLRHLIFIRILHFADGFGFYWVHRIVHTPYLYKRIHKQHHKNTNTTVLVVVDAHILEMILANLLPKYFALLILGPHLHFATFISSIFITFIEGHDTHSGYSFPISPFNYETYYGNSDFHNFHHLKNVGNFGHPHDCYWDKLFGTDKPYVDYIKSLQQKEKQKLKKSH